jgi:hypothetical protein
MHYLSGIHLYYDLSADATLSVVVNFEFNALDRAKLAEDTTSKLMKIFFSV